MYFNCWINNIKMKFCFYFWKIVTSKAGTTIRAIHIHIHTHTHRCTCICTRTCTHAYMHLCTHAHKCTQTCTYCTYTHTHMHACLHTRYTSMYIHICFGFCNILINLFGQIDHYFTFMLSNFIPLPY